MSVLIKGMEMPKDCDSCWISGLRCGLWYDTDVGNRHPDCPLIEVPDDNAPIKHGKWVLIGHRGGLIIIECSACHKRSYYQYNFCPECGAEMDVKDIYVLGKKEEEK